MNSMQSNIGNKNSLDFNIVNPASNYSRRVPSLVGFRSVSEDLSRWFLKEISSPIQATPEEGVYEIKNCHLYCGKYIFLPESDEWLEYSVRDTKEHFVLEKNFIKNQPVSTRKIEAQNLEDLTKKGRGIPPYVHICKAGASNYGHFLVEILPKLCILKKYGIDKCTILLANEARKFSSLIHSVSEALSMKINLHLCSDSQCIVGNILSVSPVSRHSKQKSSTLLEFRDILLEAFYEEAAESTNQHHILCITRHQNEKRAIINQDILNEYYASLNAVIAHPSELTFKDQIKLFRTSNIVIGGLGAGMANILFCKKGTQIIFATPGNADFFFWDLACIAELQFTWIFANPLQHWTPDIENDKYFLEPFLVKSAFSLAEQGLRVPID